MKQLLPFIVVGVGIWIWWGMTSAAWKEVSRGYAHPMKALAVTLIVAPIAAAIAVSILAAILD